MGDQANLQQSAEKSETSSELPEVNQDELIMAQEKQITDEIKATVPMVGPLAGLETLQNEFCNDPVYSKKVDKLKNDYSNIRRIRPDGNCFLRGFLFTYLEYCVNNRQELSRFKKYVEASKNELFEMGFPKFTTEDFHDIFMEILNDLEGSGSIDRVEEVCNEQGTSDYLVAYLRLLISAHLQKNSEFFSCFVDEGRTVEEFCKQEVEPMYRECDHLHIVALTAAIDVCVCVVYLDRGDGVAAASHNFPSEKTPSLYLLYRPGHYDVLYKAQQ